MQNPPSTIINRQVDCFSTFYLTETLDSFVGMAQSVATVRGPGYILVGKEYTIGISRMMSTSFEISIFPQRSFSIASTSDSGSLSSRSRLTSLVTKKDKRKAPNHKIKFKGDENIMEQSNQVQNNNKGKTTDLI